MSFESKIFNSLLNHTARIVRPMYRPQIGTPYLYWPLDWNAKDYSGNDRDGTLGYDTAGANVNPPTFVPGGISCNSVKFTGANYSLIYRMSDGIVSFAQAYTISIWILPTLLDGGVFYSEFYTDDGGDAVGFNMSLGADGTVAVAIIDALGGGAVLSASSLSAVSINTWNHVAFCSDASGSGAKLYINGAQDSHSFAYSTVGAALPTSKVLGVGGGYPAGTQEAHFTGQIDEMALFQSQLSGADIASIYSNTPTKDNSGRPQIQSYFRVQNIPCHFSDHRLPGAITSGKEGLIFQVEYTKQQPICVVPYDTDVQVLDAVKHEQTGFEYEVESVEDSAGQGQHKRVFLKRFE